MQKKGCQNPKEETKIFILKNLKENLKNQG
jgi:hypothetical protein